MAAPGVLGVTQANTAPYDYDPVKSRQLLSEIGYICGEPGAKPNCGAEIKITSRASRIPGNTELVESIATYQTEAGVNANTNIVEAGISNQIHTCGVGSQGAQVRGWKGATENKAPTGCPFAQIVEHIGFGYELFDYGKVVTRHLNCESTQSSVCLPDKQAEWQTAIGLEGAERKAALEAIATQVHDEA